MLSLIGFMLTEKLDCMMNICKNVLAALITAVSLSAVMFSFPTLNDLRIFDENLMACKAEFNLRNTDKAPLLSTRRVSFADQWHKQSRPRELL